MYKLFQLSKFQAEDRLKMIEDQMKIDQEKQKLKKKEDKRVKSEQKMILGKDNSRPKLSFGFANPVSPFISYFP